MQPSPGVTMSEKPTRRRATEKRYTLDISQAITTTQPEILPAVANALWLPLKRNAWVRPLKPAPGMPPLPAPGIRTTTPPTRGPFPRWIVIRKAVALYAYATRSESRLNAELRVILLRTVHDDILQAADTTSRRELRIAIRESAVERPFLREPDRPAGWRRNHRDNLLTERATDLLLALARAADVQLIRPEVEAALLTDEDVPS